MNAHTQEEAILRTILARSLARHNVECPTEPATTARLIFLARQKIPATNYSRKVNDYAACYGSHTASLFVRLCRELGVFGAVRSYAGGIETEYTVSI